MTLIQRLDNVADLELAKKILLGFSAAALILIPIDGIFIHYRKISNIGTLPTKASTWVIEKAESLEIYQEVFNRNTLFGIVTADSQAPVLKASIAELVKDYRLKGVVFLGEPEAILEDAKTQKTTFVKTGQSVGDLKIEEIKEGSMKLSYLGEEVKLEVQ